ncbi:MAG: hydroxymethylglutaryl-CoA reductase [Patiriisocius sp.]|jgi:hydroxymethylglutaryl-CoA reductase
MVEPIKGFSKLTKQGKIEWMIQSYFDGNEKVVDFLRSYWHHDGVVQKKHDEFIENTVSNFFTPYGVAPNFLINDKLYCVPFAIEESSVVAAAAKSASYWLARGGFKAEVISKIKIGHVHFIYNGDTEKLKEFFEQVKPTFFKETEDLTKNMVRRGGGFLTLDLIDKSADEDGYFQLKATFDTQDAMGANFINSVLEQLAQTLQDEIENSTVFGASDKEGFEVVMSILSNFTPDCIVRAEVSCPVVDLVDPKSDISAEDFANKFQRAIRIATVEPYRATTHNKGIMNGVDAVVIATGNDFRAIEACAHTYAARDGQYRSLTKCSVENGIFKFWIDLPMAMGTVGGLTKLHPMVKFSFDLLGNPNSDELMKIVACSGLAQNFGAVRSLVTTGIQKGHMKMHLLNIMNTLECSENEKLLIIEHFKTNTVSFSAVEDYFKILRGEAKKD